MSRNIGDRYGCEKCGATLSYEKACACEGDERHAEMCCGEQMKTLKSAARKSARRHRQVAA